MVRIRDVAWAFAALALAMAAPRPAGADPISLTGNAQSDFTSGGTATAIKPPSTPGINPINFTNGSVELPVYQSPMVVGGADGSTPNQLVSGFDMQNIWLNYDSKTDTMYVGIQGYQNVAGKEEIFGDASGNPNPALDPNPSFGGSKSVAVAFSPVVKNAQGQSVPGDPVVVAGIPADKSSGGTGTIDHFTVSTVTGVAPGTAPQNYVLQNSFGQQLTQNTGNLAYDPSAAHPDLEFTIKNFSKINGLSLSKGFYLTAYAGATGDGTLSGNQAGSSVGESFYTPSTGLIPILPQGISTPEPATWMAWALVVGGAGWRYGRRSRRPARS